jgi:signal transduction histidine kinase
MDMASYLLPERLKKVFTKPGFWLILALLVLITIPHYGEVLKHPAFVSALMSKLGLERHAFERILYLAPIVWAGFLFGSGGAFITSLVALALMLPRIILVSLYPLDALFETFAVFIVGNMLAISFNALRKEREYRTQLEIAHQELQANVQAIRENEKRLTSINQISGTISQSLELGQVLGTAIDNVVDVMKVDAAWIFLLNETLGELQLAAHRGISEEFARGVDKLKLGEGLSGRVAQSGEPMVVEDASTDPRLSRDVVIKYNIHSMLVVPLSSKGKVNGTLCLGMCGYRQFQREEIELLITIGNQIGVAIENARLYQSQQEVAEQLRRMQENLRFYLHQVTKAQEEERKRISHELHDETIQALVALSRQLDTIASGDKGLPEEYRHQLEEIWQQTNDIIKEVRRLSQDLRPAALDSLGLLPALEWLASEVTSYSGIETKVKVRGEQRRLPEEMELVLFRITQEALRNVWRHSQASKAEIEVEFEPGITRITVSDNGKGFNLPDKIDGLARDGKLGLAGMKERAQLIGGTLTVQSSPGKGTSITIESPA